MPQDLIRYDLLVQEALRGVVRQVMADAARSGMPGDHHFYISFRTDAPGVRLSQALRDKHPEEMTIVLQHQFWDLAVTEHAFEVGLSFSGAPERLLVPFDALSGFYDPSVQFGLKFELQAEASEEAVEDGPRLLPSPGRTPPRGAGSEPAVVASKPAPDKPALRPVERADKADKGREESRKTPARPEPASAASPEPGAEVVSLDAFRKKN